MRHLAFSLERATRQMRGAVERCKFPVQRRPRCALRRMKRIGKKIKIAVRETDVRWYADRNVVFITLQDFSMWTAPNLATTRETIGTTSPAQLTHAAAADALTC